MKAALVSMALISAVIASGYALRDQIAGLIGIEGEPIRARITLQNHCDVADHAFVVRDIKTGHHASFRGGVAHLRTAERNRLRIEISPRFKGIHLTSATAPAHKTMTMTANCSGKTWSGGNFSKE